MLTILSLDHTRSTIAEREAFALTAEQQARLARITRQVCGCQAAFLVTCNRVELIVWSGHAETRAVIGGILAIGQRLVPGIAARFIAAATPYHGSDAVRHLLRVAAGLESQVEGDVQVVGQVRTAYAGAAESGSVGPELHRLFQTALRAGKRVHHETEFGRRKASLGTAAAAVVARTLGLAAAAAGESIPEVVLLGAGKAAEAAARALTAHRARLTIVNRDRERAESIARAFGGRTAPFDDRHAAVGSASAAILATGAAGSVLTAGMLQTARAAAGCGKRPLLLIDLGFPRNIEPAAGDLPGVTLLGLQDLAEPGAADAASTSARQAAEQIIEHEAQAILAWLQARSVRLLGVA